MMSSMVAPDVPIAGCLGLRRPAAIRLVKQDNMSQSKAHRI